MPRVETDEVEKELSKMAKGKAADGAGIVAEMLKHGGQVLAVLMADVFTDVLEGRGEPPAAWKETRLKVLFGGINRQTIKLISQLCHKCLISGLNGDDIVFNPHN